MRTEASTEKPPPCSHGLIACASWRGSRPRRTAHHAASAAELVAELGPNARAATAEEAATAGDVVVVTIPLRNYRSVPVAPLSGKVVIDTMNYYPDRDGRIADLDDESTTTSELLQEHLQEARVVKALTQFGFGLTRSA